MTHKAVIFISGANRGIGLALTQYWLNHNLTVVAGYRSEARSKELLALTTTTDLLYPVKVDVTEEIELKQLYQIILEKFGYLDIVINNAGINIKRDASVNNLEWTDIAYNFEVNVGGPFLTSKQLYPLLIKGEIKKLVNISSKLGSIALNNGGSVPYRISKASLNMLTSNQALAYKTDGVTAICLHPGWVKTDMGGSQAHLTTEESVEQIVAIINRVTLEQSGNYFDINGDVLPY